MGATTASAPPPRAESSMSTRRVVLRFVLAFVGGYAFSAAVSNALAVVLARAGLEPAEAAVLAGMLGVLIYLPTLLWAFAARRPRQAALLLLVVGACAQLLASQWLPEQPPAMQVG